MEGEDWRLSIPPGFRFIPTDDELLLFYLVPKLMGQSLPCGIVTENEVYKHHPQELLGTNHEAYFFTSRNRKYPNGKRPDRKAGGGYWKATSSNKEIQGSDNLMIGHKRTLTYYMDDGTPKGRKTNWLMVEYTIPHSQLPLQDKQLDTWVICKVYLNNREKNTKGGGTIYEDQATESASHSIVHDDTKCPIEIDSLQQKMVTSKRVRVLLDSSNHIEEQAYMESQHLDDQARLLVLSSKKETSSDIEEQSLARSSEWKDKRVEDYTNKDHDDLLAFMEECINNPPDWKY
ncbi:NAC transcription factor 32-like [Elaeis guineensis]|uniref:NAC transcription factor 32-like n=1 Tax=Elaeis guineensis var. tenera TaxID=51953 RepID=UPI003C6D2B8B